MPPEANSNEIESEYKFSKKRITVNLNEINVKLIESLMPALGKSKSSIISRMVREWLEQNTENVLNKWGIDLKSTRKQILAQIQGIKIDEDLSNLEKDLIKQLPQIFETVDGTSVEDLADILEVSPKTIKKLIVFRRNELVAVGLDLKYVEGIVSKK